MEFGSFTPGLLIASVVGLAMAPFVAVMATSFTKIVVVLSLLRNALGLQQTPPNVVINGLALVLSVYVMYPVIVSSMNEIESSQQSVGEVSSVEDMTNLLNAGKEPLREFLIKHSDDAERSFFHRSAERMLADQDNAQVHPEDFIIALPAFTVTELVTAFQIGFLIFLPFLVIDLIVANILLALGMMMLPPTIVSLPFKLLLFVLVDGWTKLVHGLVLTYG